MKVFIWLEENYEGDDVLGVFSSEASILALIDAKVNTTTRGTRYKRPAKIEPDRWGRYPGGYRIEEWEVEP